MATEQEGGGDHLRQPMLTFSITAAGVIVVGVVVGVVGFVVAVVGVVAITIGGVAAVAVGAAVVVVAAGGCVDVCVCVIVVGAVVVVVVVPPIYVAVHSPVSTPPWSVLHARNRGALKHTCPTTIPSTAPSSGRASSAHHRVRPRQL